VWGEGRMSAAWIGLGLAALLTMSAATTPLVDASAPRAGRKVGAVHPEIVLRSLDGKKTYALSQFRGKKVLLVQFASW